MLNGDPKLGLKSKRSRRAVSSVLSALLLSAVVIAVGGSIWAFSQGAMTITAEDYAESVINMTDTISERFIIEQVIYDAPNLHIWVYNYGDINIEVKVTYPSNSVVWTEVPSKYLQEIFFAFTLGDETEVGIKVESRRGNNAYYRFVVPS